MILPSNNEPRTLRSPSPSAGAICSPTCVRSMAISPILLTELAIADPYFSSIRSHDSSNALRKLSKLIL